MEKIMLMVCGFLLSWGAAAIEIAGVRLSDQAQVGARTLQLNGAGVRSKFVFDVYVAALYLPNRTHSSVAVLGDAAEKRLALHLLRDVSAETLAESFESAIKNNHSASELAALDASLKQFMAIFSTLREVKKGDVIQLDYQPGKGTEVSVNGVVRDVVAGAAFNAALLRVWLGDKPAQADLKRALLGD